MISKQAIKEYKEIYKKEFGKAISDQEATEQAINLLSLMNVVYRPIKKTWLKEFEEKSKKSKIKNRI